MRKFMEMSSGSLRLDVVLALDGLVPQILLENQCPLFTQRRDDIMDAHGVRFEEDARIGDEICVVARHFRYEPGALRGPTKFLNPQILRTQPVSARGGCERVRKQGILRMDVLRVERPVM